MTARIILKTFKNGYLWCEVCQAYTMKKTRRKKVDSKVHTTYMCNGCHRTFEQHHPLRKQGQGLS